MLGDRKPDPGVTLLVIIAGLVVAALISWLIYLLVLIANGGTW